MCEDKLTEEEILELMIHAVHYAGWAAGASCQSTALAVFEEMTSQDG